MTGISYMTGPGLWTPIHDIASRGAEAPPRDRGRRQRLRRVPLHGPHVRRDLRPRGRLAVPRGAGREGGGEEPGRVDAADHCRVQRPPRGLRQGVAHRRIGPEPREDMDFRLVVTPTCARFADLVDSRSFGFRRMARPGKAIAIFGKVSGSEMGGLGDMRIGGWGAPWWVNLSRPAASSCTDRKSGRNVPPSRLNRS